MTDIKIAIDIFLFHFAFLMCILNIWTIENIKKRLFTCYLQ
jgi:hypothetical protein